jgi:beta-galactosidase/beta-glucuronidase
LLDDRFDQVDHPHPQLRRRDWIDLRGPWGFAYDDQYAGQSERWYTRDDVFDQTITVPFPPESPASGIGDTTFHPVVWYRRVVELPAEFAGRDILLHCGAIDYRADVWVNGQHVTSHEGGQTSFTANITAALNPDGDQVVVIRAEDLPTDLGQPRGKQDWQPEPHAIWYHRTTGIWQPVWIEAVGPAYVQMLHWIPDLDRGVLTLELQLRRRFAGHAHIHTRLTLRDTLLVDDISFVQGTELRRDFALDLGSTTMSRESVLWSPERPNLVDAVVTVLIDGEAVDEVRSYAGLRSVSCAGRRFMLNGRPYYLRMALAQGYWPQSHLAAPSDEAIRREVMLAKDLGFNGLRLHQKVEDPRFLSWCDRVGLLVWGEMASPYVFSRDSVDRFLREWLEVINRDASHPCIIAWVPVNESWGVPNLPRDQAQQHYVRTLFHLTKTLDPTRPVVANDGWEYLVGDVFGIHDYTFSGDVLRERYGTTEAIERTLREVQPQYRFVTLVDERRQDVPFVLSEFGGIGYRPVGGARWFGYGTVADAESFLQKYQELVEAILACPTLAGFCYTQLTDTAQETNGLATEDRRPKLDPAVIRNINRQPSSAVPADVITYLRKVAASPFAGSVDEDQWGGAE